MRKMTAPECSSPMRCSQRGFNLIEVMIAIALMGTVLVSIVGLFTLGRNRVHSGKQMTAAVAIGTNVLEDISAMTLPTFNQAFNITAATALGDVPMDGVTYPLSISRNTTTIVENDPPGFLRQWKAELASNPSRLQEPVITLVITPVPQLGGAISRIKVFVQWREGMRRRSVVLDTTKILRPLNAI